MYPLVRELATAAAPHRVPVAVTCRVLKLARQPYYRWLDRPVTDTALAEAYPADALFDAHRDDPEFGHRFLLYEARAAGEPMAERTAWRICRDNRWWSLRQAAGPRQEHQGRSSGPRRPVRREFTADGPNRLWLTDITEHATGEGKLYLCAVKDGYSGRIVGYSIDARMQSSLPVRALESAVASRGQVAGCIVHSDRGSQFRSRKFVAVLARHRMVGSMGRVGAAGDNAAMENFFALLQERPRPPYLGHPPGAADRDRHLDRAHLPSPPAPKTPGPIAPRRVRDHHDPNHSPGCISPAVTQPCSSPVVHRDRAGHVQAPGGVAGACEQFSGPSRGSQSGSSTGAA
ncbi:IS3 family transposase [Streptomyces anulatus]